MAASRYREGWVFALSQSADGRTTAHVFLRAEQRCVELIIPPMGRLQVGSTIIVVVRGNSRCVQTYNVADLNVPTEFVGGQTLLCLENQGLVVGHEFDLDDSPLRGMCWSQKVGLTLIEPAVAVHNFPDPGYMYFAKLRCHVDWFFGLNGVRRANARWVVAELGWADQRLCYRMALYSPQPPEELLVYLFELPEWQRLPAIRRETDSNSSRSSE